MKPFRPLLAKLQLLVLAVVGLGAAAAMAAPLQVTNLTEGEELRYSMVLVDGTFDGGTDLTITANLSTTAVSLTRTGTRFRCLVDLQPGPNILTIFDSQGSIDLHLSYTLPTATDYRYKVWYVVPSDEANAPVDPSWFVHFGLQTKLMQSWMAEDQQRAGNGRLTFYPELDRLSNIDVGKLVVTQTRAQAEALNTDMFGAVWSQIPAQYKDGRHKNIVFSSVAFHALSSGDLAYVGAYRNIFPNNATEMMGRLLSTDSYGSDALTFASYSGVTLHEIIHGLHNIWHDTSPNNIMGGGGYDISRYFTLTRSASNPTPHNEAGAGTLGNQRDLAAWNRYLMSADPHVYGDTTVAVAEGVADLTASSEYPLAVLQYYIPNAAADQHVKLAASNVTSYSKNAAAARAELGGSLFNLMAVDTEGNMNYGTCSGTVPVADSYTVHGNSFTSGAPGVLGNDLNPDTRTLTVAVATNVQHGTLVLNANGSFTYTPTPAYVGTDTFSYTLSDGVASAQQALVTLTVDATLPTAIPFTYVYEALDSIVPGAPELTSRSILNNGVTGGLWGDGNTQLYYSATQVTKKPNLTLTLAAHAGLGKLTVWYASGIDAGVGKPASLTVSDEFSHSTTTLFPNLGDNATFSQDVALTGIVGNILHLNFTGTTTHLGLSEIRVFEPAPVPPDVPSGPLPSAGNVNVPVTTSLGWNASVGATSYDIYFWSASQTKPLTVTATVTTNSWTPASGLVSAAEATYNWQVVAKNIYGTATGSEWVFTTSILPYTYSYDVTSARPENYGGGYGETRANPQLLNDGRTGGLWGGSGLVLYSGNNYLGNPAASWPAITLTVDQAPDSYQALRIWHYGGGTAGVHAPASLIVTDDFGHSTTFTGFPDRAPAITDVPIAGMQGSALHLRFGPQGEFVGLSEIKVVPGLAEPGYATWAGSGSGNKGLSGAAAAFDADPDLDGIPNGIEYVIGDDPNPAHPGSTSRSRLPMAAAAGDNLVFTFTRMNEAAYLNPVVEFSTDLSGPWTTAVAGTNATIEVVNGTPAAIVTVTIAKGSNTRMFARLKVEKPAVVTPATPPSITTSLDGDTLAGGGNFTLTAAGAGTPPFTLQWYFNGVAITGSTGTSYTVLGANGSHQGDYQVVVTNAQGSTTSGACHITVTAAPIPTLDPADTYPGLNLIPWPKNMASQSGRLELTAASRIVTGDASLTRLAGLFSNEIRLLTGLSLPVVSGTPNAGDIVLNLNPAIKAGELILVARPPTLVRTTDGAHTLTIGEQVVVEGFDYRAVAEGTATLLQAIRRQGGQVTVPKLTIHDWPHADYTGAMVDVARQDNPIVYLKQIIDTCRAYKTRYLQLHLTEDQAWTFPSTAYPALGTLNGSAHGGPTCEKYSLDELKALVKYADDRGVTLVPELETPGHSGNACGTLPAIFGYIDPGTGNAVGQGMMNIANPNLYLALNTIIGEMCDVFQSSPYFHIGFDEVSGLDNVATTPQAAAFMTEKHLANSSELLAYFTLQVNEMVKNHGKKTLIWEGAVTGVSKEIIHMTWDNNANTAAPLVAQGFTTITVPWNFAGVPWTDWNIYHCNGSVLKKGDSVLGAMFPAWEQTGEVHVQWLRGLPTRQERTWGPDNIFTEAGFALRLAGSDRVLDRMLYGFAIQYDHPVDVSSMVSARVTNNQTLLTLDTPPALGTVRYTVDGSEPSVVSPAATAPIPIASNFTLRARLFDFNGQAVMPPWKQVFLFDFAPVTLSGQGALKDAAGHETAWFINTMSVSVACAQTDGVVRFTLNGSDPQPTSPAYTAAMITLTQTATVKARWFDATNTGCGNVTTATWTLTTRPVDYTYTYDDASAIPENYGGGYGETRATPHLLNDGQTSGLWGGEGMALYFGNDYLGHPAAYWPAITLTVAQAPAAYEALKIWHYGGGSAGVHAPASLTVTDNYGHSTTFTGFPDNAPAITDVPITNMQGSSLHLRFTGTGEFVGLNEIRVSAAP
ncbi:MAG: family 20 glycosylhydrolase [Verrucomicrobiota bacterium]